MEFRFPNVWILRIAEKFKVVNVIAPMEEGRCLIYIRTYLRLNVPPPLARLAGRVTNIYNRRILAEDYPVIRSQRPKVAGLNIGEHFIPADRPIAVYLQHRHDLIKSAEQPAVVTACSTFHEVSD